MSYTRPKNSVSQREDVDSAYQESIVVVCAADNNYAMPLAVTMRSAIENLTSKCKIVFYIIDGGISKVNKQKILKSLIPGSCRVEFIEISNASIDSISGLHRSKPAHVSIASFYRLLLPELLPEHLEKVIYLDCDLTIEGDLWQLWQADLGENYLLAVRDTWIPFISSPPGKLNYQKLGIDPNAPYFNAGVLVINLKKWRNDNFSVRAIRYFMENLDYIGLYDQGLLNALFVGKWEQLDARWNFNVTSFYDTSSNHYYSWNHSESLLSEDIYNSLINSPYIIHFVSENKPWVSRYCPYKETFFKYVDKTQWSGWRITIWRRLWRKLFADRSKSIDWI